MIRRLLRRSLDAFRKANDPVAHARGLGVAVGENCRILGAQFGSEPYLIEIGDHVTVASGVQFITHDGGVWVLRDKYPDLDVIGRITVFDNVFIGNGATIMPGVTIGPDSVVAACAVVTKDVPARTVVAGVPARMVRTLEEYEQRSLARGIHVR